MSTAYAQNQHSPACSVSDTIEGLLLTKEFVDLKGKEGVTVLKSSTPDTLRLSGRFDNYLPYYETNFSLVIPPRGQDSLKFYFNYPDFIFFLSHNFRILNGPGRRLICDIKSLSKGAFDIRFTGDFAEQNNYYLAYHNHFGSFLQESRPYYQAGDRIKNYNKYPALADSINQLNLAFLNNYNAPLPPWFKKHEYWRLMYNTASRKFNVLFSKEFHEARKIETDSSYFNFEKSLFFNNKEMILNTEYLYYAAGYLNYQLKSSSDEKLKPEDEIKAIDTYFKEAEIGDVLKMFRMSLLYMFSKTQYDSILQTTYFKHTENKTILDSVLRVKNQLPRVGEKAPVFVLKSPAGKEVSLSGFAGHPIIINFWATWCLPCIQEFRYENKLYQQYRDKGLIIINVCLDSQKDTWKKYSAKADLQMINVFADSTINKSIKKNYSIDILPRSILIGPDLKVLDNYFKRASLITDSDIEKILKEYSAAK